MKFSEYAAHWMESAELAPKTREQYDYVLRRINPAIGHIALDRLRVEHLLKFFKNLREEGIKETGNAAVTANLRDYRKSAGLTQSRLSELANVALRTAAAAERGERVSVETAEKICTALNQHLEAIFTIEKDKNAGKLSDRTIWHHYKVNTARHFLETLMNESDIRIKTALMLDLFTGLRRGELCGLEWPDINFDNNSIRVRRASQYISKKGVIEVKTKNNSSDRNIDITPFVASMLKQYQIWWTEHRLKNGDKWQGEKERLFIQNDGKPLFPSTINSWLNKFIEKHGFPHITPHGLRHTFVTLQLTAGVDIRTLQSRSGHAQASTLLNIYSHAIQSSQEKAALALDDVLLKKNEVRSPSR
jgi:integrase